MSNSPVAGKHGFSGECSPGGQCLSSQQIFSVGIFCWVPKKGKDPGLKKSPVIVRVSGPFSQPQVVYHRAKEIVSQLDNGTYRGPKKLVLPKVSDDEYSHFVEIQVSRNCWVSPLV
jgi:hypothetical protein